MVLQKCTNSLLMEILIIYYYDQQFLILILQHTTQRSFKKENMPAAQKMVFFDVKSLFTNVPLDRIINIILKRIYDDNELRISISRNEMKELLLLCTKKIHHCCYCVRKRSTLPLMVRYIYKLAVLIWGHPWDQFQQIYS